MNVAPSCDIVTSPSAPNVKDVSALIVSVPDIVSAVSDLKKFAAATPPNASESVAVPVLAPEFGYQYQIVLVQFPAQPQL